jgi:hypothetical protein
MSRINNPPAKSLAPSRGTVELTSPLSPDALLSRLGTLRHGGHPPYQCPAPLDQAGVRVRVDGNRFYLVGGTIWGRRTSYRPAWRGIVEPGSPESGGSCVRVEAGPSLKTIISWCVFLAWFVVIFFIGVSHGIPVAGAILFLGSGVVGAILLNGAMIDLAAREREVLLGVLRQIVEAPAVNGPGLEG